jgi:hypothetical protein
VVLVPIITISNKTLSPAVPALAPPVALLILLGVGLILAEFRVDVRMLRGGDPTPGTAGCRKTFLC